MTDTTKYQVMAYDINGEWIDTSAGHEGMPTYVTGAGAMLTLLSATDTGIRRDLDAETETTERVAYFRVSAQCSTGRYYHGETHVTEHGRRNGLAANMVRHRGDAGVVFGL